MPELPEVENLRIGLLKVIIGQKVKSVEVRKPKLISGKGTVRTPSKSKEKEFIVGLTNERFISIERRAKNLIFTFNHGKILLVHLKMSGQFVYQPFHGSTRVDGGHPIELSEKELPSKHTHVTFELETGTLFYNDTRMFGYLLYYKDLKAFETEKHFDLLGVEPLSKKFTVQYFKGELKKYKGKIKAVLMDQKIVTGLGNIYADESLFEARIQPERSAASLSQKEINKLHNAIIRILKHAVALGGSSMATYKLIDNSKGNYGREHKVYGKAGKTCPNCKNSLIKTTIQSRTTIFCPRCQK